MSAWRRKALEYFPEHRRQIEDRTETASIYQLLFFLYPLAEAAHHASDRDLLTRLYAFARWCWQQKRRSHEPANAIAVCFYENLTADDDIRAAIPEWVDPDIFEDLQRLLHTFTPSDKYAELVRQYNERHGTSFACPPAPRP